MIKIHNLTKNYIVLPFSIRKKLKILFYFLLNKDQKKIFNNESQIKFFSALNNLSAIINPGENIGILGLNGSGKSTLLKILVGSLKSSGGFHNIKDEEIELVDYNKINLNGELTINEAIDLNLINFTQKEIEIYKKDILNLFDFANRANDKIYTLSSGMKSRLFFGISLISKKKILAIDEILGAGDPYWNEICCQWIKKLNDDDKIFIMTSHNSQLLQKFCQKGFWLNDGEVISSGNIDLVSRKYEKYALSMSFKGVKNTNSLITKNDPFSDYRVDSCLGLCITSILLFDSNNNCIFENNKSIKTNTVFPKIIKINYRCLVEKEYWPTFIIDIWEIDGTRLLSIQNKSFKLNAKSNIDYEILFNLGNFKIHNLKNIYFSVLLFNSEFMTTANESLYREDYIHKFCSLELEQSKDLKSDVLFNPFNNSKIIITEI